jgi:tetratricopeptide (TPR) repeat protein
LSGDRRGQANALRKLGTVRYLTGDFQGAAGDLEQAVAIYRTLGDRGGEVTALNETGTLHRLRGEPAGAQAHHQQALELARAIGSAWDEAHGLAGLGRCAAAGGHTTQVQSWDIRGMETTTRSTLAIILPGGERSPSPNRDRL